MKRWRGAFFSFGCGGPSRRVGYGGSVAPGGRLPSHTHRMDDCAQWGHSGGTARSKVRAGASLVAMYTALAYEGPSVVTRVKRGLADCLDRDGFKNVAEAVGADHRRR